MSLLNEPDALPSGFRIVCRFLNWNREPIDEDDLIDAMSPAPLREGQDTSSLRTQASNLLREIENLGLITREGGRVALIEDVPGLDSDSQEDQARFRRFVRRRVLCSEDEITKLLAWLFMQDLFAVPGFDLDTAQRLNPERTGSAGGLNDVKWKNLERWAVWMGLAWTFRNRLIPDPSAAIIEEFPYICENVEGTDLSVERFLELVAEPFPVLDRGNVFRTVRAEYGDAHDPETLSPALSFAFENLENARLIRAEHRSDSAAIARVRRSSTASATITHVVLLSHQGGGA